MDHRFLGELRRVRTLCRGRRFRRASRVARVRQLPGGHTFNVGIRTAAHLHWHELKILFHGGDYGEPCATVMLPDDD